MEEAVCVSENFLGMNTEISCKVFGLHAHEASFSMQKELTRLENLLSRYIPHSDIGRVNHAAGKEQVAVASETYHLLSQAKLFSKLSQGKFNVMVGPLIDMWDYKHALRPPKKASIEKILKLVDLQDLILIENRSKVALLKKGQSIDLGGIAKGYAANRCLDVMDNHGISSAFLSIGGNVVTRGNKPDGSLWKVGIQHPRKSNSLLGILQISDTSLVTSGDYERYFEDLEGKRWHHILDPNTGYPAQSDLISVTVVCCDSMIADALSTIVFVTGKKIGLEILSQFSDAEAIFVDEHHKVMVTKGLVSKFQAADSMNIAVM